MTDRRFVDTNVWVYAVDVADLAKRDAAVTALTGPAAGDLALSAQVLGEFFVTVTRKLTPPLDLAEAARAVDRMSRLHVVPLDARLVAAATAGSIEWGISYWDAMIVVAAQAGGCAIVLTEDLQHGATYGSVRVENPFLGPRVGLPS
jgi:predicted nucleic acid-binding protein